MTPDVSDDAELDKLLEEINQPVEETDSSKLNKKTIKGKKDDEHNSYDYSENLTESDLDW